MIKNFLQKSDSSHGRNRKARKSPGQSMVEFAITLPVIILLFAGLVEFGFMLNYYLSLLDATRNSARFYANSTPFEDGHDLLPQDCTCTDTALCPNDTKTGNPDSTDADCFSTLTDFFHGAANLILEELEPSDPLDTTRKIILNPATDDIIVTVFAVSGPSAGSIVAYPSDGGFHIPGYHTIPSRFSRAEIASHLIGGTPNTGIVLVEVFYNYHQNLAIPWLAPFLPNPTVLYAYSMMPLVAAEPP